MQQGNLVACTQNNKITDEEADIEALKEIVDRYLHAVNTNDMDLFMTCWAEDARRLEADYNIIVGKADIFKRQADGTWKIYIDHTSPNPVWSNDSISDEMLDKQDLSDPML